LVNTAIAAANDPEKMSKAFALAVESAELALHAGPPSILSKASASSPTDTFSII
jgi:thiazole synthase